MSFLSGSSKAMPAPAQKPLGLDESRVSTNEQARPVPYVAGKTKVGLTWITEAFNVLTSPVTSSAGKGRSVTTGYNYYASIAGLICWGPLDGIHAIYLNSELVWSGGITRGAEDYVDITIEGYGAARLYWGTETQDQDAELLTSGYVHPPYRGQAYLVFTQLYFGFNQTSAPNVELVVSRYPAIGWMTAAVNVQDDCNPVAILAEWLQSPRFGLGLSDARLATAALDVVAAVLEAEGIGLSPCITRQTGARALIQQLCEYLDAAAIHTPSGAFALKLIREPLSLETVTAADLAEEPDFDPESWRDVRTKTWIKFLNRDQGYKEAALPYRDPGAHETVGENTPVTLERSWVTRANLAQKLVAASGRGAAIPRLAAKLRVLQTCPAAALEPGDAFNLQWPQLFSGNLTVRIKSKALPKPGSREVVFDVEVDRSYLNDEFHVPADDTPPTPLEVDPEPFVEQAVVELPRGLNNAPDEPPTDAITLATLAARPNQYTVRYDIWLRSEALYSQVQPKPPFTIVGAGIFAANYPETTPIVDKTVGAQITINSGLVAIQSALSVDKLVIQTNQNEYISVFAMTLVSGSTWKFYGVRRRVNLNVRESYSIGASVTFLQAAAAQFTSSYTRLDDHDGLAKHGTVVDENYSASTELLDTVTGLVVQLDQQDTTLESLTLDDALAGRLLLFVDDEIISVLSVTLLAAGKYRVFGLRARFDTRRQAHNTGAEVWIIERRALNRLRDAAVFQYLARPNFKLQPWALGQRLDLADATPVEATITNRAAKPLAPLNLRCFEDGHSPTYTTGEDLELAWDVASEKRGGFWSLWDNPVATGLPYTILEFYTTGGVLKRTVSTSAGASSYTYDNTTLQADFGGEPDILVRATHAYGSNLQSLFSDELTVIKA